MTQPRRHPLAALLLAAVLLAGAAAPAAADPSPQLVASVQRQLPFYGIETDVSQYDTPTVVALFSTLNQPEGYLTTRRKLRAILRNPVYRN